MAVRALPAPSPAAPDRTQPAPAGHDERLLVLLKVIPCGVLIEDSTGRVLGMNDQFRQLFELPGDSRDWVGVPGSRLTAALAPRMADPDAFSARAAELIRGRSPLTEDVDGADGRVFERDYLPVYEDGRFDGQVWMYWDFTERKATEAERERQLRNEIVAQQLGVHAQRERALLAEQAGRALAEQNQALSAIDALRSQLLATASHELRTPLTAILSFNELLTESIDATSEEGQFVEVIGRNAARLLRLVDDLLLLAGLESGAQSISQERLDLVALVRQALADVRPVAASRSVVLDQQLPEQAVITGDPGRLRQALDNLISNAVKYSHDGGAVTATVWMDQAQATIIISDNGIGVPEAEVPELFGQFFRASNALSAGVPGTGLGLAIVATIVELHAGTIELVSATGTGTTVTIRLPV